MRWFCCVHYSAYKTVPALSKIRANGRPKLRIASAVRDHDPRRSGRLVRLLLPAIFHQCFVKCIVSCVRGWRSVRRFVALPCSLNNC
jgi:hypothetical protein